MKLSIQNIKSRLEKYDVITFDLFDTLVTRTIRRPNDLFSIVDKIVSKKFNLKPGWYINARKKAKKELVLTNLLSDFDINQIYKKMSEMNDIDKKIINSIKNIEIKYDLKTIIPRYDMLQIFNYLVKQKKRIIIVSDTYYPSNLLKTILTNCQYFGYQQIISSCEIKRKKADGRLWSYFFRNNKVKSKHVGDNLINDKFQLLIRGKRSIKILSSHKISKKYFRSFDSKSSADKIIQGLIFNKCLFNSPFSSLKTCFDTPFKFGYSIFGPMFLYFFIWLTNNVGNRNILFFSREGYYIQKLYKSFIRCFKDINENPNHYLLTSRYAAMFADLYNWHDIKKYGCKGIYNGTAKAFFKNRFDIDVNEDSKLSNPFTILKTRKIAKKYEKLILKQSKKHRDNYLNYLNKLCDNNSCFCDLGYRGTIPSHLSRILRKNIPTFYVIKWNPINKPCPNNIKSCFKTKSAAYYIYVFAKFLEPLLTAPYGQFMSINENGKVQYRKSNNLLSKFAILDDIYMNGVVSFFRDFKNYYHDNILDANINGKNILKMIRKAYLMGKKGWVTNDISKYVCFEDNLSGIENNQVFKAKKI